MSNVNIFECAKPQGGEFFKFKNLGDSIQGTYIDVRESIDSYGNEQFIYVLVDASGKIWNLGFRKTATIIHERMKGIHFGQIVGFRFDEERESKRNQGTKVHIIRIYADPKLVDTAWLEQRKQIEATWGSPEARMTPVTPQTPAPAAKVYDDGNTFKAPDNAVSAQANLPVEKKGAGDEAIKAIFNLAITKGLINDGMDEYESIQKIEQFSGLALTDDNFTKIIIKITGFTG